VDTRALTRKIRTGGPQNAVIYYAETSSDIDVEQLLEKARGWKDLLEFDLTEAVTCSTKINWTQGTWKLGQGYGTLEKPRFHVVAVDYGIKHNILRRLTDKGCRITVVPARTSAEDILALKPDGVFLSNGPGDPVTTAKYALPMITGIIESNTPLFGICLGHQLLALALGARTEKMRQGHRGANHPIRNERTGKVEITSQNHGYVADINFWPEGVNITHFSLFDHTIAGLEMEDKPVFSVQYHPESSPGPHDSRYLFDHFIDLMENNSKKMVKAS
jgi:carbamoyl-phosphate synthase small subunit